LGMTPTDGALIPATWGKRVALARDAGRMVMELIERNIRPADIMTDKAFENAIAVDMAIGGSTNTTLHLPAIAKEVGITLDLNTFQEIAARTPQLALLKPAGKFFPRIEYRIYLISFFDCPALLFLSYSLVRLFRKSALSGCSLSAI